MPRFKRPETSILADYGEPVSASVWGVDDEIDDMPAHTRRELGLYPPAPRPPAVKGYDSDTPLMPVIGSETIPVKLDEYFAAKVAHGLIKTRKP